MKNFTLTILAALLVSSIAMAESRTGDIVFNGSITNSTCRFESSSNVDSHNIYVNMGNVSTGVISSPTSYSSPYAPIFSATVIASNGTSAVVKCSATAKNLSMTLKPTPDSLWDYGAGDVLKVTGGAVGVGIGIYDSIAGGHPWKLKDKVIFSKTAAELAEANAAGGIPVKFAAAYVRATNVAGLDIPVSAGAANAVLPFEMRYE